jgi:hypothetical protein
MGGGGGITHAALNHNSPVIEVITGHTGISEF